MQSEQRIRNVLRRCQITAESDRRRGCPFWTDSLCCPQECSTMMTLRWVLAADGTDPVDKESYDEEFDEKCPKSKKPCGHHCNHSWTHDKCCYCNEEFGEDDA